MTNSERTSYPPSRNVTYFDGKLSGEDGKQQTPSQRYLRTIWGKLIENLPVDTAEIKPRVPDKTLAVLAALFQKQVPLVGHNTFDNGGRPCERYVCQGFIIDKERMRIKLDLLRAHRTREAIFYPKLRILINGELTKAEITLEARPNIYFERQSRTCEAILLYPEINSSHRRKIDELPRGAFVSAINELVNDLNPKG